MTDIWSGGPRRRRGNAGPGEVAPPGGATENAAPRGSPKDADGDRARPGGPSRGDWPAEAGRSQEPARSQEPPRPEEPARPEEDAAARITELEDKWRRALADLDNYRKRTARALERERGEERARTSAEWLPVLDNLERALEHAEAEPGAVIQGVRSVLEQARDVIARLGFPRRDDDGEPFDPTRHEAVSTVADSDAPDGTVVQVVRPGYGEGEGQLRPAQVVVAKGRGDGPGP
jgi:molecular chaperone GrpE